jgi:hypothetical protein
MQARWAITTFLISNEGQEPFEVQVSGRNLWALDSLMRAGAEGCTPIDDPAPRWSGYVFDLRELGVQIETIHEAHDGPFSGFHGRYVLQSIVAPVQRAEVAA